MSTAIPLRIISYNIHKGLSATKTRNVLEQIRESIRTVGADIVFLQEVRGGYRSDPSQFEYLADEIWEHFSYGKNAIYQDGHHGNAILSKFPVVEDFNVDISNHAWESRGLLYGRVAFVPGKTSMHLVCLHLDLSSWGRSRQLKKIIDWINLRVPDDEPLIVAGDFNDWRENLSQPLTEALNLREVFLETHGEHARTFPSFYPLLRMDRIYVRGLEIVSAGCMQSAPWTRLSDHLAICSDLLFKTRSF